MRLFFRDIAEQVMEFGAVVRGEQSLNGCAGLVVFASAGVSHGQLVTVLVIRGLHSEGALQVKQSLRRLSFFEQQAAQAMISVEVGGVTLNHGTQLLLRGCGRERGGGGGSTAKRCYLAGQVILGGRADIRSVATKACGVSYSGNGELRLTEKLQRIGIL